MTAYYSGDPEQNPLVTEALLREANRNPELLKIMQGIQLVNTIALILEEEGIQGLAVRGNYALKDAELRLAWTLRTLNSVVARQVIQNVLDGTDLSPDVDGLINDVFRTDGK